MLAIDGTFLDFKQLDILARRRSAVHDLDPRTKVLTTCFFILCVVSYDKYEISAMLPFFIYPAVLMALGDLPLAYILRKVVIVIPFALMIGLFNPFFDRQVLMQIGPLDIWGGWVSCFSILLRAILTAGAAIVLVAITGFAAICASLEKMKMPQAFAVQLMFLYRYIFVLTDEAVRTARARQMRVTGKRGLGIRQFSFLVGHLLLRTWERAERIHMAMLARGFKGHFFGGQKQFHFARSDFLFIGFWLSFFFLARTHNLPLMLGDLMTGNAL